MTDYPKLLIQLEALIKNNKYDMTILANSSALLFEMITEVNWVGFYINHESTLLLGPFQGRVACTEIPFSKGVCGACATNKKTLIVPNVHEFKGHIACDTASNSEICIPLFVQNKLYAILDIDSPIINRFTATDQIYLEKIVETIVNELNKIIL